MVFSFFCVVSVLPTLTSGSAVENNYLKTRVFKQQKGDGIRDTLELKCDTDNHYITDNIFGKRIIQFYSFNGNANGKAVICCPHQLYQPRLEVADKYDLSLPINNACSL